MKIYNRRNFWSGLFFIALGILNISTAILRDNIDVSKLTLVVALIVIGIGQITRSMSKNMSIKDKIDELDERNVLINLKSKSKAFQITQVILFVFIILMIIISKVFSNDEFIAISLGLAV